MSAIYYHNPKCSKSRAGLEIIEKSKLKVIIKEYLNEELHSEELITVLTALKISPLELMRKKEQVFSDLGLADKDYSDEKLIELIIRNPILLERPVLKIGDQAVIGRPTEKLETFLERFST